jgi:hypothetical protein
MFFKSFSIKEYLLLFSYLVPLIGLFLYSFTQIDLSLALSRNESMQEVVRTFQQIGYFERPLSANLFLIITVLLFIFYIVFLRLALQGKLRKIVVWTLIGISAGILTFSYNAFSYDVFNYIFDAKIITNYGDNPYVQKALDYPEDPMLSFMRWTHRVYPYGPVWLGLTLPLSFIGFQFFLPTFLLFKIFIAASFVGSVYFIGKILQKVAPDREIAGLVFYGLNPLILIESVVSTHIDSVMMFFALWAMYLLVSQRHVFSYGALVLSIGIKFATAVLLPVFLIVHRMKNIQKKIRWGYIFGLCVMLLIGATIAQSMRSNFQPWYLIDVLAFGALIGYRYYVLIPAIVISFAAVLNYLPFLFYGNWDKPIPQMLNDLNFFSYSLAFFLVVMWFFYQQIRYAQAVKKNKKRK